jgi:AraC-like DNA-binding protein
MDDVNFLFRMLALSQIALLGLLIVFRDRHYTGYLALTTCFAFSCYLVAPFSDRWLPGVTFAVLLIATILPSMIWLLFRRLFQDHDDIPLWLILFTVFYAGLSIATKPGAPPLFTLAEVEDFTFFLVPQICKLLLVVHVLYMAVTDPEGDLIDQRIKLRKPLGIGAGSLAALVILVEIWAKEATPALVEAIGSVLIFGLTVLTNIYLFRTGVDFGGPAKKTRHSAVATEDSASEPALSEAASIVLNTMQNDRFYATHGATLTDLATVLGIPVHKLRDTINRELGYNNFNQFLNEYRINEASTRLRQEDLPILSIALDVGFKSLSSFNVAFKRQHAMTPSEFRTKMADVFIKS